MKKMISFIVCAVMIFSSCFVCASAEPVDTVVQLQMVEGAAIRLGEVNGLRFYTSVDEAARNQISDLIKSGYKVELGTLISPLDIIGNSELTFDLGEANYLDVRYTAGFANNQFKYFEDGTGFVGFVGSIINIKLCTSKNYDNGNKKRDFVARGYVKVTDKDGNQTITYASYAGGNIANNTRRLFDLATAYKKDATGGYNKLDAATKKLVDEWATWVVYSPRY